MIGRMVLMGVLAAAVVIGVAGVLNSRGAGAGPGLPAANAVGTVVPVQAVTTTMTMAPVATPIPKTMPADTAVVQALKIAQAPGMGGRLVGEPTRIRGKLMTYAEFHQLAERRPLEKDEGQYTERDRLVWVVEFQGTLERPPSGGRTFPVQMVLAIDGVLGEYISQQMATPGGPEAVNTTALPVLPRPTGTTPPPGPTNTPYPAAPPSAAP